MSTAPSNSGTVPIGSIINDCRTDTTDFEPWPGLCWLWENRSILVYWHRLATSENPTRKIYCLVRILGQRRHWAVLLWKWRWLGHHRPRWALQIVDNQFIWTQIKGYGRGRHVVPASATQRTPRWIFCMNDVWVWTNSYGIGHKDRAIWPR